VSALSDRQRLFARMVAQLFAWLLYKNIPFRLGEAWRSREEAARLAEVGRGTTNSLHCDRLALDLQIDKHDGTLGTIEEYAPVGEYWESLGGSWGGRFSGKTAGDVYHFSLAHGGRK